MKSNMVISSFVVLYTLSFIPVYIGAFMILFSIEGSISIFTIVKLIKNFFSFKFPVPKRKLMFNLGIMIFLLGWFMPYIGPIYFLNIKLFALSCLCLLAFILIILVKSKFHSNSKNRSENAQIEIFDRISDNSSQDALWTIYNNSFQLLNEKSPCRQSFHKKDFIKALMNDSVIKCVIHDDDKYIGLVMISNNFINSPWISEDYFRVNFPEEYKKKIIYYFMGIVIDPQYRQSGLVKRALNAMMDELPNYVVIGFDHSFVNNKKIAQFPYLFPGRFLKKKYLDSMDYYVAYFKNK